MLKKILFLLLCAFSVQVYCDENDSENGYQEPSETINCKEEKNDSDDDCKNDDDDKEKEPKRRALPAPFASPPFPSAEYQGYPLIGVPYDDTVWPLTEYLYRIPKTGDWLKENRINLYGWINYSVNASNCRNSNMPFSYWLVPNAAELDQLVIRLERQVDSVQTDHVDIGFRSTFLYGIDYRYMNAGGWTSFQLLTYNNLYGYDFTEQYVDIYIPKIAQGLIARLGRWIACPDIETQFAPDNYMGSHSLLFTFDTYTQTGLMLTWMMNENWTLQAAITAGTDMAIWYPGALPTGMFGIRWVAPSNKDSIYLCLNNINAWKFRHFKLHGQPAGHDNFNYLVGTWQHKFNDDVHTKTESYIMWQRDTVVGGTVSIGPAESFGGGGGIGAPIPGTTFAYGAVNYTMFRFSDKGFVTVRNEAWKDQDGERSGFFGLYTSHAIGFTYNITKLLQVRPEAGYYRNWDNKAFDLGEKHHLAMIAFDMTLRF